MTPVLFLGCPPPERGETARALAAAGLSVLWADDVAGALGELQRSDVPVVVDLSYGDRALQHARELKSHRTATLLFAVVDPRRADLTIGAIALGVADVFARPLGGHRLRAAIDREVRPPGRGNGDERRGNGAAGSDHRGNGAPGSGHRGIGAPGLEDADETAEELYSHSRAMREVKALVARAAALRVGVLICGEPGTGRRMVARNIHAGPAGPGGPAAQARPAAAFVTVDCAAADPEQVEHDLFGQIGRPLGGDAERRTLERVTADSRLVAAGGGTLYLRNVVEMSSRLQSRLVRVFRDREVILAGAGQKLDLDVRPIAAVDPSADRAVKEGRLREDLLRRLSALRIDVPPLRGRREDIPALANHFLREMCADRGVPVKTLTRPALSLIAALPWSGNAVELRALLEQIVLVAAASAIAIDDVLAHVRLDGGTVLSRANGTLRQARERFEREYIASVLEHHRGRITEAARALGIQRPNLYRKMRSLKVSRERRH